MSIVTALSLAMVGLVATMMVYSCNSYTELADWMETRSGRAFLSLTVENEFFWLAAIGVTFSLLFL